MRLSWSHLASLLFSTLDTTALRSEQQGTCSHWRGDEEAADCDEEQRTARHGQRGLLERFPTAQGKALNAYSLGLTGGGALLKANFFDRDSMKALSPSFSCPLLSLRQKVSMKVRNPYVDPLNVLQAEIMKRLRKDTAAVAGGGVLTDSQKEQRITLEDALIVSVNGIAQGMKNSG